MAKGKKMTKKELIEVLVNKYGYDKSDLKDENGRLFTNAKLESIIKQEEEDAKRLENEEMMIVAKDNGFKDDDLIVVMSGLPGTLIHRSQTTGRVWRFHGFGQTDKIPYSELLRIRNSNPKVFEQGWMIILNRKLQEEFNLTEKYKNILTPENIETVFKKDLDDLKLFVKALPEGMKVTFINKARELYQNGKLDSIKVIDFIQEEFNISLDDNAPLSDIAVPAKRNS